MDIFAECDGQYYIKPKTKNKFDERIWVVDKQSKKVRCTHIVEYLLIRDRAHPVNKKDIQE